MIVFMINAWNCIDHAHACTITVIINYGFELQLSLDQSDYTYNDLVHNQVTR